MKEILAKQKHYWGNKHFAISAMQSLILFVSSMVIHYTAGVFATEKASSAVTDILLGRLPVVDVSLVFAEGNILFWLIITAILLMDPKRIPFTLKSLAAFMIVRSMFVVMTHLGPDPREIIIPPNSILDKFTFGGDLFFSGHTGAPYLMALLFWHKIYLRFIFLATSAIFGVSVLLGHLHYSIDVFAAFFITFGIYHIVLKLFPEDRKMFLHGLEK